ncbi:MAG: NADH-quinone oxidoreductase subunit M [Candidatus Atribacteria bacterium]|nr:NADH-quinone oxidoreductase subunit M [Candidatus Atribacteria bacterium]
MQFPFLSVIVFIPMVTALVLLLMKPEQKKAIRITALTAAMLALALSIWVYFSYDKAAAGYQFIEKYNWMPMLGISLHFGVDGLSVPLVLLTGIVMVTGVMISWGIDDRPREFFAFLFILASGVFGVFASLDLFMLFFFYEIAVFPMFLLIVIWGWIKTREYAAMKLTLYLFIGSLISLIGALAMYWTSGLHTFNMLDLEHAAFSLSFQKIWFPFVFLGFAILGGIFPFHNWSPDGHVAAPTAVSMFHAGVLMKLGAFAALRVGIMLLPEGAKFWSPLIMGLALVNIVYGAFIASVQTDFKYVIGFSSVSHMGLVMMGFATLKPEGLIGAGVQMFSHGVMTALFFAAVGMVYDRAHTRDIPKLGGMIKPLPLVGIGVIIGSLVSMGMPGFSGFVAEFPIFIGIWKTQWVVAVIAAISIVVTASYVLLVVRRVFFGKMPEEFEEHIKPINTLDKIALVFLMALMIGIGLFPALIVPWVQSGVQHVLTLLGGA